MDPFSRHELLALLDQPPSPGVSLYLPTRRAAPDTRRERLDLANLLRRAEQELVSAFSLREPEVRAILEPARALEADDAFWRERGDGLAVFLRQGWWRAYRLPLTFPERVVVARHVHVLPLLPLFTAERAFYVLALSENEARLFAGTREGLHELSVADLPHGVRDALRYDEPQKQRGHHLGTRVGATTQTVRHGQGIGAEVQNERLGRYLRAVEDAVRPALRGQHAPLVLAGVERVRAMFRGLTHYAHVLDEGVSASPDRLPASQLHARALEVAGPVLTRRRRAAVSACTEALGTDLASTDPARITEAAASRRIDTLLLSEDLPASAVAQAEAAVADTLRSGGTVYSLPSTEVPAGAPVAALLRY